MRRAAPPKSTLNGPPDSNLGLWVKLPRRIWDKIKWDTSVQSSQVWEETDKAGRASMGGPRPAGVLKIIPLWFWAGGGHIPQAYLLLPDLQRLHTHPSPPRQGGRKRRALGVWHNFWSEAVNTHPLLHKLAQLWNPTLRKPHSQDIQVRGRWVGVTIHQRPWSVAETYFWGLAPEHCTWCKMMQLIQNLARDSGKLAPPPPGGAPGHFYLAQTFINLINSMPFSEGPSPTRRPD